MHNKSFERLPLSTAVVNRGRSHNGGSKALIGNYMTTTYEEMKAKRAEAEIYNPVSLHQRNGNTAGKPQTLTRQNSQ